LTDVSVFLASLPAAATNTIPAASAAWIAARSEALKPPPPQELLLAMSLTPRCFIWIPYMIALMALEVLPLPEELRNFPPISFTFQATPVTPTPLLPTAPMVPATWVP
jgi:hypothetical protein